MMIKKALQTIATGILSVLLLLAQESAAAPGGKPNILIILADDLDDRRD